MPARHTLAKIEDIEKIAKKIAELKNVKAVYLFGSYALGNQNDNSDIDICVLGNISDEDEREILFMGPESIDISIFNKLPLNIKFRVLKEGKPLIVRDEKYMGFIKSEILRQYLDFKERIINVHMNMLENVR